MRRLRRTILAILAIAAAVPLLGVPAAWLWLRSGLPDLEGTVSLPGLVAKVEIARDANAVPHIFAQTQEDAYFALGYVHAQDRLWQMDLNRRIGAGRLSELIGAGGLRYDKLMRTLGFYRDAEASVRALAPEVRMALEAYAAGVNAWLANRSGPLPIEFQVLRYEPEPWRPADSIVWGKLMALQLSGNYTEELLRARMMQRLPPDRIRDLFPDYPASAPVTLTAGLPDLDLDRLAAALPPPLGPATASNEWVVAGDRTGTGLPVLANDPHLQLGAPILWYLARIEAPGFSVTGATVPGVPFHLLGRNDRISWGFTTTGGDVQDLFVERLDPADPSRYLTPDGPEPFARRDETIRVKDAPDETLTVRTTRHGPVLSDIDPDALGAAPEGHVVALAFTGLSDRDTTPEALYRLARAPDWEGFKAALRHFQAPLQNIVYADIQGNIGFYTPGLVPIRRKGDGSLPVPGWTGEYGWTGAVPFDQMPQSFNPPAGRIVNANNRIVGPDYPHFLTNRWDDWYRAARIEQVLGSGRRHDVDAAEDLLMDNVSVAALELLPEMLRIDPSSSQARTALDLLRAWDGTLTRDRPEPLIFEWWLRDLHRALYADELGDLFADVWSSSPRLVIHMLRTARRWCDDVTTPDRTESCPDVLAASLDRTLAELAERHGDDPAAWRWGLEHRAPLGHQVLSRVPVLKDLFDIGIETDGGNQTVNRGGSAIRNAETPFAHIHGAGYRAVYDMSDPQNSRYMIATGQSGNPLSPHYGDLVERWRDGEHFTIGGSLDAVAADGLGRLTLVPPP
ncbi:penicillin acylase family protein [Skermanella sp. TT6]|uniref:Penicillin acylase family protein n=1 Tax=Skermanella cutis TaxID=2775420 RepID=A0ABX7B122_9PROT|nr:penicillin acylase family protein [Skermanella sp. TT6]QQP87866.1 penicillin acylase family protein [Skermanella sp. TT6]